MAYMYDVFNDKQGAINFTDDLGRAISLGEGKRNQYPLSEEVAATLIRKGYKVIKLPDAGSVVSIAGISSPTSGLSGAIAMDGTIKQLTQANPKSGTFLKAPLANTQPIYIGYNSDVSSSTGFPLSPGDQIPVVVSDLSLIYCIGPVGNSLTYFGS